MIYTCGKEWHLTQEEAQHRVSRMLTQRDIKRPETLSAYYHDVCEGWHVGHNYKLRKPKSGERPGAERKQ